MSLPEMNKTAPIDPTMTTEEAFQVIMRHNFRFMVAWEPIAFENSHIEGVHQARVAFRRMRSAWGLFRPAIPREAAAHWNSEMRWAASEMGPARDLDVFLDEALDPLKGKIPLPEGEAALTELAKKAHGEAYVRVRTMIESERYHTFKKAFVQWVDEREWRQGELTDKNKKQLDKNITPFAAKVLDKRMRKVLNMGHDIRTLSEEALHELRIEGKKLRYALDFFNPLFTKGKGLKAFMSHLKEFQGFLGVMNDVTVMRTLLDELLAGEKDLQEVEYAGALIGWRARQYEEIKGKLETLWDAFSDSQPPWWHG